MKPIILANLPDVIFSSLKEMDEAATTVYSGFPTGLRWYDKHENPNSTRKNGDTEPSWSRGLKTRLKGLDIVDAHIEQHYGRAECDLVVYLKGGEKIWIEVKGAWTYLWREDQPGTLRRNSPYLKHLLGDHASAAHDFAKLSNVTPNQGTHVGILLVGFDDELDPKYRIPATDIEQLRCIARVVEDGWIEHYKEWSDPHQPKTTKRGKASFRVRSWFWYRPVVKDVSKP